MGWSLLLLPLILFDLVNALAPDPPRSIVLQDDKLANALNLHFQPPWNDGGQHISKYLIECDSSASFDPTASDYWRDEIFYRPEIQEIILDCGGVCSGTFTLGWGGKESSPMDINSNLSTFETEVSKLLGTYDSGSNGVEITKASNGFGDKWLITFVGTNGDIGLISVNDDRLSGDKPSMSVREVAPGFSDISPGSYTTEIQSVTIKKEHGYSSPLGGWFTLSFEDSETDQIAVDASAKEMKIYLEELDTLKSVNVERSEQGNQITWLITFKDLGHEKHSGAGDIEMIKIGSSSFVEPSVTRAEIFENVKGSLPMEYIIHNFSWGNAVYCRISSYNPVGYSDPSAVVTAIPCSKPGKPTAVFNKAGDMSLEVSWDPPVFDGGSPVNEYFLEWFSGEPTLEIQQITTSASDGVSEVQIIRTSADENSIGGFFTLSFLGEETGPISYDAPPDGPGSVEMHLRRLSTIGEVKVKRRYSTIAINEELFILSTGTNVISRKGMIDLRTIMGAGDRIFIGNDMFLLNTVDESSATLSTTYAGPSSNDGVLLYRWANGYEWEVTFSTMVGSQTLLVAKEAENWSGVSASVKVERFVPGRAPLSGSFQLMFGGEKTKKLPHNASAAEIKLALQSLKDIGHVNVSRYTNNNGWNYLITFSSLFGDLPLLGVDFYDLLGPSASVKASTIQDGVTPTLYGQELFKEAMQLNSTITELKNGIPYTILISASNNVGRGHYQIALPTSSIPMKVPSAPTNVELISMSDAMIKVVWMAPWDEGGSSFISKYRVQWDVDSNFTADGSNVFEKDLIVDQSQGPEFCLNIDVDPSSSSVPRFVRVSAHNGYEWSPPQESTPKSILPRINSPGEVGSAIAFATSHNGIMVEWTNPDVNGCHYGGDGGSAITHYILEWDEKPDFSSPAASIVLSPDTRSHQIGGRDIINGAESALLNSGSSYFVRVTAFNSIGSGVPTLAIHMDSGEIAIGPLTDSVPSEPMNISASPVGSTSIGVAFDPPELDGGSAIQSITIEHSADESFLYPESILLPAIREVQGLIVETESLVNEVHSLRATVEVLNEVQSVRSSVAGVDEIQTVTTTCDDVVAEVQTVTLHAADNDEVQLLKPDADDVDELQLVRISGNDVPEIQDVSVTVTRIHEVQNLGVLISSINTNSINDVSVACHNVNVGEPCQEIEDALVGSFTVSFEFDKCGGENNVNFCQAALSSHDPSLGIISCSPGFVSNPMTGGDHCVSLPVVPTFSAVEGDASTLQWALNTMVDDKGKGFMTSSNMPTKQEAVTVSRIGRVKSKGPCTINSDGIAECVGEYEISYSITFDAEHSSGDVPSIKIVHSDVKIDTSSSHFTQSICPAALYANGCTDPIGTALDNNHGNFYQNSAHDAAIEAVKGSQPLGMISLDYECESQVTKLSNLHTMVSSVDGMSVTFDDDGSFLSNSIKGQWLRFADSNGLDVYRKIASVEVGLNSLMLQDVIEPSITSNDVEYGYFFSDWSENDGPSGVSSVCQTNRIHQTLAIDATLNLESVSTNEWKQKLGALAPIDSTGLEVSRYLLGDLTAVVGFRWSITFNKQPGSVNKLNCRIISMGDSCTVQTIQESSIIDGTFRLGTTWPHEYVSESPGSYLSGPLRWNVDAQELESELESVLSGDDQVFGELNVSRDAYIHPDHSRWSGGYTWVVTFLTRPGNIPAMDTFSSNLFGVGQILEISDSNSGSFDTFQGVPNHSSFLDDPGTARDGNQVAGSYSLTWLGNSHHGSVATGDVFLVQTGGIGSDKFTALSAEKMKTLLTTHIFSGDDRVLVSRSSEPTQAMGYTYTIQFVHENVGGDLPPLTFVEGSSLHGINSFVDIIEQSKGNEIRGTFQLRFEGQTTRPIAFDATAKDVENALNDLSTISPSAVIVSRTNEPMKIGRSDGVSGFSSQVGGFEWSITFASSIWKDPTISHDLNDIPGNWFGDPVGQNDVWESGFSKGWGKNVGDVQDIICISSGLTTTNGNFPSNGCQVSELKKGTNPLGGQFKLCLDSLSNPNEVLSVTKNLCTDYINHDAPASATESGGDGSSVEEKLEALKNIGDVSVSRSSINTRNGGYTWSIQFLYDADGPCQQKDSFNGHCNAPGNVPKLCDGFNNAICEDGSLLGTCDRPGYCSKLTILDATDHSNNKRPPSAIERQRIIVKDTDYEGWADGTHIDIPGVTSEYKLSIDGTLTNCIPHNAAALVIQNELQSILDGMGGGVVLVHRSLLESEAPNGFIYFVDFYDTGDISVMLPIFTYDSSVCANGFSSGKEVAVLGISDGSLHSTSCEFCADGVVQRGDLTFFELENDSLSGHLPWNADPLAVKQHLEQIQGRHVEVGVSYLDKYGACEWTITFTGNPHAIPPGSLDIPLLDVQQGADSNGLINTVHVTEVQKGTNGLSGFFTVDYGSPNGPIQIAYDEPPGRLQTKLNALNVVGEVFVTRDCFPSCDKGGWGNSPVIDAGTLGGLIWKIYFLKNPGNTDGVAFPPGSSDIDLPSLNDNLLFGNQAIVAASTETNGSPTLNGMFQLSLDSEITDPIPFNAGEDVLQHSLSALQNNGGVSVRGGKIFSSKIPGITATAMLDEYSLSVSGDDIRKHLVPGDQFRVAQENDDVDFFDGSKYIGRASLIAGSPLITNSNELNASLFVGEAVWIQGRKYQVERNGVEVQQLTLHNGLSGGQDFSFKLTVDVGGVKETTPCIPFSASDLDVQNSLNSLPNIGKDGVKVTATEHASGKPGDPHVFKVYFLGNSVLGNLNEMIVVNCADVGSNPVPYSAVRTILNGGKVEHQKVVLSADSGNTDFVPSFALTFTGENLQNEVTPCIEWGASSLNLSSSLDESFSEVVFTIGMSGVNEVDTGIFNIASGNYIEGTIVIGDKLKVENSCVGTVISFGSDGKSSNIVSSDQCLGNPGENVFLLPDTRVIEKSVTRKRPVTGSTELVLSSDAPVSESDNVFKLEILFRGQTHHTQCLPYGVSESTLQAELNSSFDYNGDGVIDVNDEYHVTVVRRRVGFGYSYLFESKGSRSVHGVSTVLGSYHPTFEILGIGTTVGCKDIGGTENFVTSTVSTTNGSPALSHFDISSFPLHAGSRVKISGSSDIDKIYTISHVHQETSTVTMTEPFSGTSQSNSAAIHVVHGPTPHFLTRKITEGVNEYEYDIFFIGNYWHNVPLLSINRFADGTCEGDIQNMNSGMNRNLDVSTIQDGGGMISSMQYALDESVEYTSESEVFSVPPIFTVMEDSLVSFRVVVSDNDSSTLWSSGQPSFKISNSQHTTNCINFDSSETDFEESMKGFCSDMGNHCVTVTRSQDLTNAPNGFVFKIHFEQEIEDSAFFLNSTSVDCGAFSSAEGESVTLDELNGSSRPFSKISASSINLGMHNDPLSRGRWLKDDESPLFLFKVTGHYWVIRYDEFLGDAMAPGVIPYTLSSSAKTNIFDDVVTGLKPSHTIIPQLETGVPHFARLFATNEIGPGPYSHAVMAIPSSVPPLIQDLKVDHAMYANEVQTISIVATHINEIQKIVTSAVAIPEVQELTIQSELTDGVQIGNFALRFPQIQVIKFTSGSVITQGSFYLELNYVDLEASNIQNDGKFIMKTLKTPCIPVGSSSELVKQYMEIGALQDGLDNNSVQIVVSGDGSFSSSFGFEYTIKFVGNKVRGNLNQLQTDLSLSGFDAMGGSTCTPVKSISNDVTVKINTLNEGGAIGSDTAHAKIIINADGAVESGQFALSVTHLGLTLQTICLDWNSESQVLQNALENLSNIDKVRVERRGIGSLSNDENSMKERVESITFLIGQTTDEILLPPNSTLNMSDILFIGARLQFEGQSDYQKFYTVLSVNNGSATLNDSLDVEMESLQATLFSNYEYTIYFNGQGMHPDESGTSQFAPGSDFSISTTNCNPFKTFVDNVLVNYSDADVLRADVLMRSYYNGGSTLTSAEGDQDVISSVMTDSIPDGIISTLSTFRSLMSNEGSITYTLTFGDSDGDLEELVCNLDSQLLSSSGSCGVGTIMDGNTISGYFYLGSSDAISYDATAEDMEIAIEKIPNVTDVEVARSRIGDQGGYEWKITFLEDFGDLADLSVSSSLKGKNASVTVIEEQKGNQLGGYFKLTYGDEETIPIPFNAMPTDLKYAIEGLDAFNSVFISETDSNPEGGKVFAVTFVDVDLGDIDMLGVETTELSGIGSAVSVTEKVKGSLATSNSLHISFSPPSGCSRSPVGTSGCGNAIIKVIVEADFSGSFIEHVQQRTLLPNLTVQTVKVRSIAFPKQSYQRTPITGSFRLQYKSAITRDLTLASSELDVRKALEELPDISTLSVKKDFSAQRFADACVDVEIGSSLVKCSVSCTCNFGTYGLKGNDLIQMNELWYRVSSSYDGDENEFRMAQKSNSLNLIEYRGEQSLRNEPLLSWAGGFQWEIMFHSWKGELWMLESPKHNLIPEDSTIDIDLLKCNKCLALGNLNEWSNYFLRARAQNELGSGSDTMAIHAVTKSIPNAPTEVMVTVLSGTCIELSMSLPTIYAGPDESDELQVVVEWDIYADFRSNDPPQLSCSSPLNGRCEVEAEANLNSFKHEICNLSPSVKYYVRVAAKNSVEVQVIQTPAGAVENLRWSAMHSITPMDQVPDSPLITTVSSIGQSVVQVVFEPPLRDGGKPVTQYSIHWELADDDSSSQVLTIIANSLSSLEGSSTMVYNLEPTSPQLSPWETYHIYLEAINAVGTSLQSSAKTVTMKSPPRPPVFGFLETPIVSPNPISNAFVSWERPTQIVKNEEVDGYLVEWWSAERIPEIQIVKMQSTGVLENTEFSLGFSLSPTVKKVTAMMPWDASSSIVRRELINLGWDEANDLRIIDNIDVERSTLAGGYEWKITFGQNFQNFNYGDVTTLVGTVSAKGDTGIPFISTWTLQDGQRPQGRKEVQFLQIYGTGDLRGAYRLQFEDDQHTPYITANASAPEIEMALKQLPLLKDVSVSQHDGIDQSSIGSTGPLLHHYEITFLSNVGNMNSLRVDSTSYLQTSNGDVSIVIVDGDNVLNSAGFKKTSSIKGEAPPEYYSSGIVPPDTFKYELNGLVPGREYFVAVSAMNSAHGFSKRMTPSPPSIVPPLQVPQSPENISLTVNKGISDSLLLSYRPPISDGGASVFRYRIELDPTANFDNPIVQDVVCPSHSKRTVWEIATKSNSGGIINGGSFSLRLSGRGFSEISDAIPYDAVALAQNETGTTEVFESIGVFMSDGSPTMSTSPSSHLEQVLFPGDRLRFSGQKDVFKFYQIASVAGYEATLSELFEGTSGLQIFSRHYGGRGNPSSSRIYCEYDAKLCSADVIRRSGSMQNKINALKGIIQSNVLVDRDGPSPQNEFIWRVTFLDDAPVGGSDFVLDLVDNHLTTANSVGSVSVLTTLITDGETYDACEGTQVVPKYGGLVKGLLYHARVAAINSEGYSVPARANQPQAPIVVPGPPTSVSLDVVSGTELRIMFASPIDNGGDAITKYMVEWDISNTFSDLQTTTIEYLEGGSPFFKTISNLTMGQEYFFRVKAWNSEGYGTPQNSYPPSLNPHQTPSSPKSVKLGITCESMLTVGWSPPFNDGGDAIRTYRIEWDTRASFTSTNGPPHKGYFDVDAETDSSYTITLLSPEKVYFTRVFAINTAGMGSPEVSAPLYSSPTDQVPGKVMSLTVHQGSPAGTLDIHWQRPLIPHHGIPCSGTLENPVECPVRFGGNLKSSDGGQAIAEYEVEYNERADFSGSDGGRKVVIGTFTTIQNLTSGRTYYIRVLARNTIGSGQYTSKLISKIAP